MRIWPKRKPPPLPTAEARPEADRSRAVKSYYKDAVTPWLVSGGSNYFLPELITDNYDVRAKGVQLVCYVYIPSGSIGFLKQLRVAPFRPSCFNPFFIPVMQKNPDSGEYELSYGVYIGFNPPEFSEGDYPDRPNGVWEEPFAWEKFFNPYDPDTPPPWWRWYLRIIPGNIENLRLNNTNLPPKPIPWTEPPVIGQLESYYLVPDIAVPAEVYTAGVPGSAPGEPWDGQRVQVIQGDQLSIHLPIPENSTLALFTRWSQSPALPLARGVDVLKTEILHNMLYADYAHYPILPSFGQMLGYTQSSHQEPGNHNAQYGWKG